MTGLTVSAEPERLYRYASRSQELDQTLISRGKGLAGVLRRFEQECAEPDFRVVASPSAAPLRDHGLKNEALSEEVRQVGRRFVLADSLQIGRSSRFSWLSDIRRHVSGINIPPTVRLLLTPIIGPPPWLISKIQPLTWIDRLVGSTSPGDSHTPDQTFDPPHTSDSADTPADALVDGLDGSADVQSPFSEVKYGVTAEFGAYSTGYLHNGVDLQPQGFDKDESYDICPVGPGRVVKARQDTKTDDNGNVRLVGYGNYVVVKHKRGDDTYYSRYAHLASKPQLKRGDEVDADTVLGQMGNTGNVEGDTGYHLHLEVYNSKAESKYYYRHKPDDIYDEDKGTTWEQKMLEGYLDPVPIIEGKEKWKWDIEWLKETED